VNLRGATEHDEPRVRALWEEFEVEVPEPPGFPPEPWAEQWSAIRKSFEDGAVYVAEEGDELVAIVHVKAAEAGVAHVEWAHVRPAWRRQGLVKSLLRECIGEVKDRGVKTVSLEALSTNEPALAVWQRLGFETVEVFMSTPLAALEKRLSDTVSDPEGHSLHDRKAYR
jgi:ribosomal protein S18 acetylase RimI-like enzyme